MKAALISRSIPGRHTVGGDPSRVAPFYEEGGSLSVNGGAPAVGRKAERGVVRPVRKEALDFAPEESGSFGSNIHVVTTPDPPSKALKMQLVDVLYLHAAGRAVILP
jgi:hypothetical protein